MSTCSYSFITRTYFLDLARRAVAPDGGVDFSLPDSGPEILGK